MRISDWSSDVFSSDLQTSQGMNVLFNRLRNLATSIANGGDVDDYIQVIDEIRRTLNRDVAGVSSGFISMSSANAQLNAILAQSAVAVGAMQAQPVSHQLQSMQVREEMLPRYLQARELQRKSHKQERERRVADKGVEDRGEIGGAV